MCLIIYALCTLEKSSLENMSFVTLHLPSLKLESFYFILKMSKTILKTVLQTML